MLKTSPESLGRLLIHTGWVILILYLPNGLLHSLLGAFVYLRDIFLAIHFLSALVYLQKFHQLKSYLSKAWLIGLIPVFLLPGLLFSDYRIEVTTYIKWSVIWLDAIILGRLTAQFFHWCRVAQILAVVTGLALVADLGTGFYEYKNDVYVLPMRGQLSPMGVEMGRDSRLGKFRRIKGLQRDVFSFANLMGMAVVGGMCVFIASDRSAIRVGAAIWTVVFAFMLYHSGGRSSFFGVGAAGLMTGGLLLAPEILRKYFSKIALGWLAVGLFISFFGIGELASWFSSNMMQDTHIGDAGSAYQRDENWKNVRNAIASVPIVLFTGSPLGAVIDSKIAPIFHWADNNYLWLLYHGSFISLAGIMLYFRNALSRLVPSSRMWCRDCLMLFLLFVMGEAIARESLAFFGCVPLFVACGYLNGIRFVGKPLSSQSEEISPSHLASLAVRSRDREQSVRLGKRRRSESEVLTKRLAQRNNTEPPADP